MKQPIVSLESIIEVMQEDEKYCWKLFTEQYGKSQSVGQFLIQEDTEGSINRLENRVSMFPSGTVFKIVLGSSATTNGDKALIYFFETEYEEEETESRNTEGYAGLGALQAVRESEQRIADLRLEKEKSIFASVLKEERLQIRKEELDKRERVKRKNQRI